MQSDLHPGSELLSGYNSINSPVKSFFGLFCFAEDFMDDAVVLLVCFVMFAAFVGLKWHSKHVFY